MAKKKKKSDDKAELDCADYYSFGEYKEAEELGQELWHQAEVGGVKMLSAPQIGISRAVFFINISIPYIVVNPHYIDSSYKLVEYKEDGVKTLRHENITVDWWCGSEDYQYDPIDLGPDSSDLGRRRGKKLLECVLFQQGYDYIHGLTPQDREVKTMRGFYGIS